MGEDQIRDVCHLVSRFLGNTGQVLSRMWAALPWFKQEGVGMGEVIHD